MFKVDKATVAEMLDDDPSLGTLKNQYTVDEIFEMIEDKDDIDGEDALYRALMDVMYATRPVGHL